MLARKVQIKISNKTKNITLENPRTYFYNGHCSNPPPPSLSPGCDDSCLFTSPMLKGCVGVLAFEAESFTLAVYFSNPLDYNLFSMELGLELSLTKIHLDDLENTYTRMAAGATATRVVTSADHVDLNICQKAAKVSAGPVKVTATMSNDRASIIRLVVEDLEGSGMETRKISRKEISSRGQCV